VAWHRKPVEAVTSLRPAAVAISEAKELIVRPKFRRAIAGTVIFIGAAAATAALGGIHATHSVTNNGTKTLEAYGSHRFGSWIAIVVCFLAGITTIRLIANEIARIARLRGSPAAANSLRVVIQIVGYLLVLRVGNFDLRDTGDIIAFGVGFALMAIALSRAFGRFHGGNNPLSK